MTPELAFAASAGMVAAFNPCGFALLPGYLVTFLGSPRSRHGLVRRAAAVGLAMTAGFVLVFGAVGSVIAVLSFALGPWLSVVTLVSGLALVLLGSLLLAGRDVSVRVPRARLLVSGSTAGMVGYGIVYAMVSLSCTLPVFLAAVVSVSSAPGAGIASSALAGVAYAAGMGLVMVTLAAVAGLLGRVALQGTRRWARHVGRVSGLVVLVAGAYVCWYGWIELQSYRGDSVATGPVAWVARASARASQVVTDLGLGWSIVGLVALLGATALAARATRGHRP